MTAEREIQESRPCRCDEIEARIKRLEKLIRDNSIAMAKHVEREQGIGASKKKD